MDFGNEKVEEITIRAKSSKGGVLVVRADGKKGNIIAKVKIPKSAAWKNVRAQVLHAPQGVHALHVSLQSGADVEVDWLGFDALPWERVLSKLTSIAISLPRWAISRLILTRR